ncbi:transmembrane protein 150C [Eucyclogobius newberryi]|uniref:transmembrane protein 150C n=1 Tax=Eucyclogobius newberryi TaxID=166745 RepID=UPI003B5BCA8D
MDRFEDRIKRCSPWALLPPLFSASVAAGLIAVYFVAIAHGKIVPLTSQYGPNKSALPPYISIAGNSPPASCIFSQIMNLGAFAGLIIAVFRYLQLKNTLCKPCLNNICLFTFSCSCFGMTLIGNFQLFVEEEIHNFGTFLTFGLGIVFCWIQSYITLRVNLRKEGFRTSILRFLLSGAITICFILYSTLMSLGLHMHAARGQWSLVMLFLIFIGTFCVEFRHSRMNLQVGDISGEPVSLTFTEMSTHRSDSL